MGTTQPKAKEPEPDPEATEITHATSERIQSDKEHNGKPSKNEGSQSNSKTQQLSGQEQSNEVPAIQEHPTDVSTMMNGVHPEGDTYAEEASGYQVQKDVHAVKKEGPLWCLTILEMGVFFVEHINFVDVVTLKLYKAGVLHETACLKILCMEMQKGATYAAEELRQIFYRDPDDLHHKKLHEILEETCQKCMAEKLRPEETGQDTANSTNSTVSTAAVNLEELHNPGERMTQMEHRMDQVLDTTSAAGVTNSTHTDINPWPAGNDDIMMPSLSTLKTSKQTQTDLDESDITNKNHIHGSTHKPMEEAGKHCSLDKRQVQWMASFKNFTLGLLTSLRAFGKLCIAKTIKTTIFYIFIVLWFTTIHEIEINIMEDLHYQEVNELTMVHKLHLELKQAKWQHNEAEELDRRQAELDRQIYKICLIRTRTKLATKGGFFEKRYTWVNIAETFERCTESLRRNMGERQATDGFIISGYVESANIVADNIY